MLIDICLSQEVCRNCICKSMLCMELPFDILLVPGIEEEKVLNDDNLANVTIH